jgi:hypothetical protein
MVRDLDSRKRTPVRIGHHSRMDPDTQKLTLVIMGHVIVFALSLAHDEIVARLVEEGYVLARLAERFEILIGLALFICWSFLTLRLVALVRGAGDLGDTHPESK